MKKLTAILFAIAVGVSAADKPNFSGTWKLDLDKSNFGALHATGSSTDKWTLSADGNTLTDVLSISSPDGNIVITHVMTRQ